MSIENKSIRFWALRVRDGIDSIDYCAMMTANNYNKVVSISNEIETIISTEKKIEYLLACLKYSINEN